jgi:hypothetical protein
MFASDSQNVDASVLAKILYAAATKASYLLFILCIGSRQIVADLSGGSLFTDGGTWLVGRWLVGSVMRSGPGFGSLTQVRHIGSGSSFFRRLVGAKHWFFCRWQRPKLL